MTIPLEHENPREAVARLEAQIEDMTDARVRCRKVMLAGRASIVIGLLWALVLIAGPLRPGAIAVIGATIAVVGGIVVYGSNASTAKQLDASIRAAEEMRAELIGRMELQVVSERRAESE